METQATKKLRKQTLFSALVIALGILIMVYGIIVEDEPTAVALLLITTGSVWLFITRLRLRSLNKLNEQNLSN